MKKILLFFLLGMASCNGIENSKDEDSTVKGRWEVTTNNFDYFEVLWAHKNVYFYNGIVGFTFQFDSDSIGLFPSESQDEEQIKNFITNLNIGDNPMIVKLEIPKSLRDDENLLRVFDSIARERHIKWSMDHLPADMTEIDTVMIIEQ